MSFSLFLLLVFLMLSNCSSSAATRAFNEQECAGLAITAGQAASYRAAKAPLPAVLVAVDDAIAKADPARTIVRFEGDREFVRALVEAAYNSGIDSEVLVRIVFNACDRNGMSKRVREV